MQLNQWGPCEPPQFRLRVAHQAKGLCRGPSEVTTGQSAAPDNTGSAQTAAAAAQHGSVYNQTSWLEACSCLDVNNL